MLFLDEYSVEYVYLVRQAQPLRTPSFPQTWRNNVRFENNFLPTTLIDVVAVVVDSIPKLKLAGFVSGAVLVLLNQIR